MTSNFHPDKRAGPRVVVSIAAFHVRSSFPGLGGLKEPKMFLPHPLIKFSMLGSLRDREIACSASDLQGLNFDAHTSHHPQEVLLAQFSLCVHKSDLKPDSFHFHPGKKTSCLCSVLYCCYSGTASALDKLLS